MEGFEEAIQLIVIIGSLMLLADWARRRRFNFKPKKSCDHQVHWPEGLEVGNGYCTRCGQIGNRDFWNPTPASRIKQKKQRRKTPRGKR